MKMARSYWTASKFVIVASFGVACVVACSAQTSSPGFADNDAGASPGSGNGTNGNGNGTNGNGNGTSGDAAAPSAAYADGGISCGIQGGCATSESCCYPSGGNAAALTSGPSCTPQGSCAGSSLACSNTAHCSGGEVCCFAFVTPDAGQDAAGGAPGFPAAMSFGAQCAAQCPTGDMVHYQLCATSTECPSGQSCVPGTYTRYCAAMTGFPGADAGAGEASSDSGGSD